MSEKRVVVNLRTVADHVGLAPCSISAVLNNTPASLAIPQKTRDRIFRAARELNYRPNLWAQSLRTKRTRLVAVIALDIGNGPVARIVSGAQSLLQRKGYWLALRTFGAACEWGSIPAQLAQRGIEGAIAIDAILPPELTLPVASINLDFVTLAEPLGKNMRMWLTELGESAAETVIHQIEQGTASRRMKVVPKFSQPYSDLHSPILATGGSTGERARDLA